MELKTIGSDAFAATSPVVEGVTGRYFGDYDEATRERVIAAELGIHGWSSTPPAT